MNNFFFGKPVNRQISAFVSKNKRSKRLFYRDRRHLSFMKKCNRNTYSDSNQYQAHKHKEFIFGRFRGQIFLFFFVNLLAVDYFLYQPSALIVANYGSHVVGKSLRDFMLTGWVRRCYIRSLYFLIWFHTY